MNPYFTSAEVISYCLTGGSLTPAGSTPGAAGVGLLTEYVLLGSLCASLATIFRRHCQ